VPPTVSLHGTDIEDKRLPKSYPSNVTFSTASVLSFSPDWSGKFDYVHQRLLMCALKREEWPVAIGEIYRVLKPGGWAQLGEYGYWGFSIGPSVDAFFRLYSLLNKHHGLALRIFAELPDLLREAGFTNVHVERRVYPYGRWAGQEGLDGLDHTLKHMRSVKEQIIKAGGFGLVKSEEDVEKILAGVEAEILEAPEGSSVEFVYVYAQKPTAG
jgi:SAM-dependent methyltransferase